MRHHLRFARATVLVAASAIPAISLADATPVGPSFEVPGAIDHIDIYSIPGPAANVAMAPDGSFTVISALNIGASGVTVAKSVIAARYDSAGTQLGAPIQLSPDGASPNIALDPTGGFVATWSAATGLMAQRFAADGAPRDPAPLLVEPRLHDEVQIAVRNDGAFVVAWSAQGPLGDTHVFARSFNALGVPLGLPFRLGERQQSQRTPGVAFTSDGGFNAVWEEFRIASPYGETSQGIYMRHWGLAGLKKDAVEHRIDSAVNGGGYRPAMGHNARGDSAVAWVTGVQGYKSGAVYGRRFSASGAPLESAEFVIYGLSQGVSSITALSIALDAAGGTTFAWEGNGGVQPYYQPAMARRFDAAGVARDATLFQLNDTPFPDRHYHIAGAWAIRVSARADGGFVALWSDVRDVPAPPPLPGQPHYAVRARLFAAP